MNLILPWPLKALNPNRRQHWAALARAKRAYRSACAWLEDIERRRGKPAADALRDTMRAVWSARAQRVGA